MTRTSTTDYATASPVACALSQALGVSVSDPVCDVDEYGRASADAPSVICAEPLSHHTTFRIGGPAECFVVPACVDDVIACVRRCAECGISYRVIGLGSDLLVSDEGVTGAVIMIGENMSDVVVEDSGVLRVQAGASNGLVAEVAAALGLAGFEFASGIPGTIGGAAIMNAGAYGGEFKDVCLSVTCVSPEGELVHVSAQEADWSYRHSMMDEAGYIVVEARLRLVPDDQEAIRARMADLAQRRREKQPLDKPSAGSTFKRPEGYFAGKLIDDAGMRGHRVGDAAVSEKHAGFVVNLGNASSDDVRGVIEDVRKRVKETSGVDLEPEVRMWGFEEREDLRPSRFSAIR